MEEPILKIQDLHVVYRTDESTVYAVNGLNLELFQAKRSALSERPGQERPRLRSALWACFRKNWKGDRGEYRFGWYGCALRNGC